MPLSSRSESVDLCLVIRLKTGATNVLDDFLEMTFFVVLTLSSFDLEEGRVLPIFN